MKTVATAGVSVGLGSLVLVLTLARASPAPGAVAPRRAEGLGRAPAGLVAAMLRHAGPPAIPPTGSMPGVARGWRTSAGGPALHRTEHVSTRPGGAFGFNRWLGAGRVGSTRCCSSRVGRGRTAWRTGGVGSMPGGGSCPGATRRGLPSRTHRPGTARSRSSSGRVVRPCSGTGISPGGDCGTGSSG